MYNYIYSLLLVGVLFVRDSMIISHTIMYSMFAKAMTKCLYSCYVYILQDSQFVISKCIIYRLNPFLIRSQLLQKTVMPNSCRLLPNVWGCVQGAWGNSRMKSWKSTHYTQRHVVKSNDRAFFVQFYYNL